MSAHRMHTAHPRIHRWWSIAMLVALLSSLVVLPASAATVGQGFVVTPADLAFILKQIKISERHAATLTPANPCGTLVGSGPDQVPNILTSYGLRTVDGSCNNLVPGREKFGTADELFPRLTSQSFRPAENATAFGGPANSSYAQTSGSVADSRPRMISNLIVDQTLSNPAAVRAAGFPVRSQGGSPTVACNDPNVPDVPPGCVPVRPGETLFIENVTTDVGLSPPFNSLFTIFGQFFDHGLDKITNGGNGTVFVPLQADDPLIAGPDLIPGNADDPQPGDPKFIPPSQRFMVLTRGTNFGNHEAQNTDSPWVDLSQDYASHASHQVFLREYEPVAGRPQATGRFLGHHLDMTDALSPEDGTMARWGDVKFQAAVLLGLALDDEDVHNIPMLATDPYGTFIPGPLRGLPQYVTASGLVEGDTANPVAPPADVVRVGAAFLNDIAHNAVPTNSNGTPKTPDGNATVGSTTAILPANVYDDELLDLHVICGDGRCNENIALSAIHTVFEHEHNRLLADIKNILTNDTSAIGVAALAEWKTASIFGDLNATGWNGGRLFQAARFITEMEYQHLVFEEFARKLQPAIQPFHLYHTDIDPAVSAEFAHAVYRLGHSMLDDVLPRINADGSHNDIPLLDGFLNPAEYTNDGNGGTLNGDEATGAIIMGLSDQSGNEIDEFINSTLRNNLLGLPLDLGTLNLTRARSEGIPTLNNVRRDIFAATNDGQLRPYTDWIDFGQFMRHPESLINFVAAYGTHPTILAETTLLGKRNAARAIVDPILTDVQPPDAFEFMTSIGPWANVNGRSITGLDDVDLWIGGLAENTNLFGGLLGPTFNYVFEKQLTDLQNGDRFYYLARTPGMNLRTQLEGNSFAELVMRNTNAHTLKADAFATADCKFEFGHNPGIAGTTSGSTVQEDPLSECSETALLIRLSDGTIKYRATNTVDPSGINGQAVYNGTTNIDRMFGGNDNDTFWGDEGNDIIDGGGGDDVALGGEGDDVLTDFGGADTTKGGPGNDAIDTGIGDDLPMGGPGQDFINGGANDNETFAGPGNDFIIAGQGADVVFGDGGDDWIQGGSGQDLLQGDHGAPFFDDPGQVRPGNDIFVGQVGENDYDAEGGDDIMSQNAAVDRNAGAGGFDWAIHQYNTVAADDDITINQQLFGLPIQVVVNRDRWGEVEALSGDRFNDTMRGDSMERITGPAGFIGCDALDNAGVNRITGLRALVNTFPTLLADVVAASAVGVCPLVGSAPNNAAGTGVWAEGNIILGGGGSDLIEGRGNNDIIDGDHTLHVHISIRSGVDANGLATGPEIATTDLMESVPTGPGWTGALAGKTLQAAVFARLINPGQLIAVREIVVQDGAAMGATPNTGVASDCPAIVAPATTINTTGTQNCDISLYSLPPANYTFALNADGSVTVAANGAVLFGKDDGIDTLWNIEALRFCTANDPVTRACTSFQDVTLAPSAGVAPAALNFGTQRVGTTSAAQLVTVTNGGLLPLTISSVVKTGTNAAEFTNPVGCAGVTLTFGLSCTISVAFAPTTVGVKTAALSIAHNAAGSPPVVPLSGNSVDVPGAPTIGTTVQGNGVITVNWTAPASNGGTPITGFEVRVVNAATNAQVGALRPAAANATSLAITGLTVGTSYRFQVRALNAVGAGPFSALSAAATFVTVPGAPLVVLATNGAVGGAVTANVIWTAPTTTGGSAITGYQVTVVNAATNAVLLTTTVGSAARTLSPTIPVAAGTQVRFQVRAVNAVGTGAATTSNAVIAR